MKCAIGKKGIGYKKKEGDLSKGRFKIKLILYRKDRVKLKTKLERLHRKIWFGVMTRNHKI